MNKLTGQAAIDFAIRNEICLHGNDYSSPYGIRSCILSDKEAQEMVNEGITDGVWCWTDEAQEPDDSDNDCPAGDIMEDEDKMRMSLKEFSELGGPYFE